MGAFVGEALEAVGKQTHPNWEIIAVDDGGPEDGTRRQIESFAAKFPQHRIEFIRHQQNAGVSAARNTAISASKGALLAFLDPDDIWRANHLELHLKARAGSETPVVSASAVKVFMDSDRSLDCGLWATTPWEASFFPSSLAMRNSINPSAVVAPRELIDSVGGFDLSPELQHVEDWDLWLRLTARGVKFKFLHDVTVDYRKHEQAATADSMAMTKRIRALTARHRDIVAAYTMDLVFHQNLRLEALESRLRIAESGPIRTSVRYLKRIVAALQARSL
jgi:glycosyltransferase involved in cell wall biosynthesis